jgi:hypothetical protein
MTSPRKPGFVLPVAVTLAVLLGLYVGASYQTVQVIPIERAGNWEFVAGYSLRAFHPPQHWGDPVFAPVHWFDRRTRPDIWEPD